MYQTIQLSSHVSAQGEFVKVLADGQVVIRIGDKQCRGQPIARRTRGGTSHHESPPLIDVTTRSL